MKEISEKKIRQSNIELLRILAAVGVIILHYNNAKMGGGFLYVEPWSINQVILMALESICVCAVNLFVLISGYFMANKKTADLLKPLSLIAQVIVYALAFYVLLVSCGILKFSVKSLINCFIPNNWFVILYAVLFIISPYLNHLLNSLSLSSKKQFVAVLFVLFSLYPTITDLLSLWSGKDYIGISSIGMDGSQNGYTIVNFILMYAIGNLLNSIEPRKQAYQGIALFIIVALVLGWAQLDNVMHHSQHSSWAYCNPLLVIEAVLVFQIFRNFRIKESKIINRLASASFSVYILHTKVIRYVNTAAFVNRNPLVMVAHLVGCCLALYLISWIVFEIYSLIEKPIYSKISQHWKKYRIISI